VETTQESYEEKREDDMSMADGKGIDWVQAASEAVFSKGQSKRIWNELYKVHLCFHPTYIRLSIHQIFL
jgi:nuclear GTP-binding protein